MAEYVIRMRRFNAEMADRKYT